MAYFFAVAFIGYLVYMVSTSGQKEREKELSRYRKESEEYKERDRNSNVIEKVTENFQERMMVLNSSDLHNRVNNKNSSFNLKNYDFKFPYSSICKLKFGYKDRKIEYTFQLQNIDYSLDNYNQGEILVYPSSFSSEKNTYSKAYNLGESYDIMPDIEKNLMDESYLEKISTLLVSDFDNSNFDNSILDNDLDSYDRVFYEYED